MLALAVPQGSEPDESAKPPLPGDASPVSIPTVPMLDLSREYARIGPELLAAVEGVLAAQNFILGQQVTDFEAAAAGYCHASHAIGCSSGTDALWLTMAAAKVGPGDAVVTTPFSFFATASSIARAGARVVFADIDPRTFNLDPKAVDRLLVSGDVPGVKAVLPVHLYGQPAEWDSFEAIKQKHGLLLIEDAAQAFGAAWDGRPAGSLGDLATFSFYPTKNLSASGDAGMVTTSDELLAERVRMLRAHGMRRRYYHEELGWNCRLDTLQAAILLVKMKYISEGNARRRDLAGYYDRLFNAAGVVELGTAYPAQGLVLPWIDPRATHVFHQYVVRVSRRDELVAYLKAQGIGSEVYYPVPLHLQAGLRQSGYKQGDFPEAERAAAEVLALPMYPELREEEQERVVAATAELLS